MDEREEYIAAMNDLKIDKRLGENIAKIVANENAMEEEAVKASGAETGRADLRE